MAKKTKKSSVKKKQVETTPHPTAGPKITEFEEKLQQQLSPGDVKRGRGRPLKQPEPEPAIVPNEIVKQAIQVPFDLWAISQNLNELKLNEKEISLLAEPVKSLLDYYAPKLPVIAIAWASLTVTTYSVMRPRLELIAEIKKRKSSLSSEPADKEGQGQGGPTPPGSEKAGEFPLKIETQKV